MSAQSPRLAPEQEFETKDQYHRYCREQREKQYYRDSRRAIMWAAAILILTGLLCCLIVWLSKR